MRRLVKVVEVDVFCEYLCVQHIAVKLAVTRGSVFNVQCFEATDFFVSKKQW